MDYIIFSGIVRKRIIELASQKKYSMSKLCTKSHVAPSTLNKFMNDPTANMKLDTLDKLCYGLGITIQDFFNTPEFNSKLRKPPV